MDVRVGGCWQLVVYYGGHVGNVQAARSHVRGHQHGLLVSAEAVQRLRLRAGKKLGYRRKGLMVNGTLDAAVGDITNNTGPGPRPVGQGMAALQLSWRQLFASMPVCHMALLACGVVRPLCLHSCYVPAQVRGPCIPGPYAWLPYA